MKDISKDWLIAASDDLEVVRRLIEDDDLTHMAAFHAQQCVEKCLKAIIEEKDLATIRIHSLRRLFGICKDYITFSDNELDIVIQLDSLYIEARYPGDLGLLPNGKPSYLEAELFMNFAQEVFSRCQNFLLLE